MALGLAQPLKENITTNISCGVKAEWITFPLSCAECLEIWEPRPPGTLRVFPGL